jgi:dolichol-phosphate mannosyltransferase
VKRNLTIVVNFNQEKELPDFLARLNKVCSSKEVVIIDDGSTDRSLEILASQNILVIQHETNRGIGAAIRTGINYALSQKEQFSCVTIISSNGKLHPEEIAKVSQPVLTGKCDYSQGSRFLKDGLSIGTPKYRQFLIPILTKIGNIIFGTNATDITCGFRCYTLTFLQNPLLNLNQTWLDRYELEFYLHFKAHKLGLVIKEVPITVDYSHLEQSRKSKIIPIIGWWSIVRPFLLLGLGLKR